MISFYAVLALLGVPSALLAIAFVHLSVVGHFKRNPSDRIWRSK